MCFHVQHFSDSQKLQKRFKAKIKPGENFTPKNEVNGFNFPKIPVITNSEPETIQMFNWGLLPSWTGDIDFRKNTLNAKIETINEKPSFKDSVSKRCLVLVDGFYEWQWLDAQGKKKQKYLIQYPDSEPFAMAGLFNIWTNPKTLELFPSFTILTTEANSQMSIVHNSKNRMPMVLSKEEEAYWLTNKEISRTRNIDLKTIKLSDQFSLFD
jgi:putative SOS response-associated peptidase YedK